VLWCVHSVILLYPKFAGPILISIGAEHAKLKSFGNGIVDAVDRDVFLFKRLEVIGDDGVGLIQIEQGETRLFHFSGIEA